MINPKLLHIVKKYVPLRKTQGSTYRGKCPRCHGKPSSFYFYSEDQNFQCFECKWTGSLANFLIELEKMCLSKTLKKLERLSNCG